MHFASVDTTFTRVYVVKNSHRSPLIYCVISAPPSLDTPYRRSTKTIGTCSECRTPLAREFPYRNTVPAELRLACLESMWIKPRVARISMTCSMATGLKSLLLNFLFFTLDGTYVRAASARAAWQDKRVVANRVISSSEAIAVFASPFQLPIVPGCHAYQE